jgi:hypothetical protein
MDAGHRSVIRPTPNAIRLVDDWTTHGQLAAQADAQGEQVLPHVRRRHCPVPVGRLHPGGDPQRPIQGFWAELGGAISVFSAFAMGTPISTTTLSLAPSRG